MSEHKQRSDRTVHATIVLAGGGLIEYVRYDRSGRWYREYGDQRAAIAVHVAVSATAAPAEAGIPAAIWHEGRPGGTLFDARVRRARAAVTRTPR